MNPTKNIEKSVSLSKHKGHRAKRNQCYYNAFRAVQDIPEFATATYVEGIAVTTYGFEFEHAWLEVGDEIIDPTIPSDHVVYFPGLRCEGEMGIAEMMALTETTRLPFFQSFGWGGHHRPEFREARRLATEFVKQMIEQQSQAVAQC